MTAATVATYVLLVLGVACQAIACVGVLVMRDALDRIHFAGAGTTLGPILVAASLVVRRSFTAAGIETLATVAILCLLGSPLVIATGRAARRVQPIANEDEQ